MTDHVIVCPGCQKLLHVPTRAIDKPAHCPHCRAAFHIPPAPGGGPGTPVKVSEGYSLPRVLLIPAFGLLMLGLAGTAVNGYLSVLFAFKPGAALEFARGRVTEARMAKGMTALGRADDWELAPHAAVAGGAGAAASAAAVEAWTDEQTAAGWAPNQLSIHVASTIVSALTLLGGAAILRGRFYWLALIGCLAAIVNVNHLCCVPGAITGIWGILSLVRDEGRAHFRLSPR
ncbi:hypothetical protein [Fimbriiglobus ruber]|uniref:Uncharacterized protein n=1 Tax=Fimbriiglobus ruber TaxID=1908690 RepID=A0A225DTK1_9BACT|nr:hypothetical protein [Fimbriiglobus ruber]OWK41868.1 hypothetical protein FRUB_03946 [Fimbriiglobus ruber]